ncbi:hypothetical protein, partial [Escherichia coli]|uniref:hypothetical protein n=1 Tax=Escherichia coli TaxID=562 RepID=UPI001E473B95
EWVHVQLHQQKGMISLSPPTICNSALFPVPGVGQLSNAKASVDFYDPSKLCFHFFHILFSYCDYQLFS